MTDLPLSILVSGPATAEPPRAPATAGSGPLRDAHGRAIRDLRLSVTDRCNFRCVYCMAPDHKYLPKRDLLDVQGYTALARVAASLGIDKVRLTGGEPVLYPDLDRLIANLGALPLHDLAMTTNGSLLTRERAERWRGLGLRRLTFSLDSLRPERTTAITRSPAHPDDVRRALEIARDAGLGPLKVNAVVMRGVNDDEVADFAQFARDHAVDVRLIEWMPLDSGRRWTRDVVCTADEMVAVLRAAHDLVPLERRDASETAFNFAFADGAPGRIGIIASVTRNFCGACSRMRITADGKLRPCLFSHDEWDLRPLLARGASDADLARFIRDAMWTKQAGHGIDADTFRPPERGMSAIGG